MAEFFAELKRRHIYRVGAAYVVAAWALTQVVEILAQVFALPLWIAQTAIVLLAIGFPIALIVAWTIESKPHEAVAAAVRAKPTIVDWTLCGALAVVVLLIGYQQLAPSRPTDLEAARSASLDPVAGVSLAVLPFANLSSDPEQEFFSDGITEEVTTALARIPDLRVVARTSAYQFRAQNRDIQSIGQQLRATHFIEGSVRKAGERVRITAQLVKADDGVNLWANSYDRELTDVFAIQEDIARAIAASLRMPLNLPLGQQLVDERAISPQSHESYLRARNLVRMRDPRSVTEAIRLLDEAVARDPEFAPAWGLLGTAYHFQLLLHPAVLTGTIDEARSIVRERLAKGTAAAERAIALNPKNPDGIFALAQMRGDAGDHVGAMELVKQALALDPDHPDALQRQSIQLAHMGYVKQALPIREHLQMVEPFVPAFQAVTARLLFADGQTDAAVAILESLNRAIQLPEVYASQGRFKEAADRLHTLSETLPEGLGDDNTLAQYLATAERLLRSAPNPAPANDRPELGILDWVYAHVGDPARVLGAYDKGVQMGFQAGGNNGTEWAPVYSAVRKTARFKKYIRDSGIFAYWEKNGWPSRCRPVPVDDFECE
jgi:TolB-like protein